MERLSKKEKRYRLLLAIAIGVAVGLLLILGVRVVLFYASDAMRALLSWLMHLLPSVAVPSFSTMPSAVSTTVSPASLVTPPSTPEFAPSPVPPAVGQTPTSTLSSATYTELFSGVGFDDAADTTVYEDYVATSISLVPDFSVSPTTAAFSPAPTTPAGVPASENLSGAVTASVDGKVYTASIPAFPDLVVTSSYPGIVCFGYDPATKKTLIIYAAYESRVIEMGPTGGGGATAGGSSGAGDGAQIGLLADYSARFGSRAFAGDAFGSRAVDPVIFSQDGAWWIFSGAGSTKPKLMKIQDGAVIDYTQTAFPREATLAAAPGPASHEIYVAGNSGSYILTDNGFKQAPSQWVSSKLNQWDGDVAQGEITSVEDSGAYAADAVAASASIPAPSYFLSNDGGATWIAATPGEPLTFPASGSDFRFKVGLSPAGGSAVVASANSYASPWVDTVRLEYWVARSAL
jgi:hypothetical protein